MVNSKDLLEAFVTCANDMTSTEVVSGYFSGKILLSEENVKAIKLLSTNNRCTTLAIGGLSVSDLSELEKKIGQNAVVEILQPNSQATGLYFGNWDSFLACGENKYEIPDYPFFIEQEKKIFTKDSFKESTFFRQYKFCIEAIEFLTELADVQNKLDDGTRNLYFLNGDKLEIPLNYNQELLVVFPTVSQDFLSFFRLSEHSDIEHKKVIFKNVIIKRLQSINLKNRFSFFFKDLLHIQTEFINTYELYIKNYSFEKKRDEINEKKIAYISSLNSIVNDLVGKMLSIPLAQILIATNIKGQMASDLIVLVGTFIFGLILWKLVTNNENTFQIVAKDIDSFDERVKKGFESSLPEEIKNSLKNLVDRKDEVNKYFCWGKVFIVVTLAMAVIFFFHVDRASKTKETKELNASKIRQDAFPISPSIYQDSKTTTINPVINFLASAPPAIQLPDSSNTDKAGSK